MAGHEHFGTDGVVLFVNAGQRHDDRSSLIIDRGVFVLSPVLSEGWCRGRRQHLH